MVYTIHLVIYFLCKNRLEVMDGVITKIFSSFLLEILMIQELLLVFENTRSNHYLVFETFSNK